MCRLASARLQVTEAFAEICPMQWKDGNGLSTRTLFGVLDWSFRLNRALREMRSISSLSLSAVVFLLCSLALRSWILFGAFLVVLVVNTAQWLYYRYFIVHAKIDDLDEMTGWEFEKWLRRFFERVGYEVYPTPYRGDFGADFVLTWNGTRIAVQAKRASRQVGLRAVQEVVAAKAYYDCERAMVVTNSYYTEQAIILARANGVWLRTRDDLARKAAALGGAQRDARASATPFGFNPPGTQPDRQSLEELGQLSIRDGENRTARENGTPAVR